MARSAATRPAPASRAACRVSSPIIPAPTTTTVSSSAIGVSPTACTATDTASINAAWANGIPSGSLYAIRAGTVTKQYLCLMVGHPSKAKFDVNAPLMKSILQGGERMVRVTDSGKPSLTFFREMEQYPGARLMQATLGTGRTHQIRVHAQHVGHPLAGDPKYGDKDMNRRFKEMGLNRLFLHASHMSFEVDGRAYSFSAPMPDDLKDFLDVLSVKGKRLKYLLEKSRTDF